MLKPLNMTQTIDVETLFMRGILQVWFMTYLHLLPSVNNEKYGEGEMSRVVVFVYIFAFNLSLTLSPLEVC